MTDGAVAGFMIAGILLTFYMIPTIIASARHHHNTLAIAVMNVFLGWTFVGWVAALVWSCTNR